MISKVLPTVEILDKNLKKITEIKRFYPLSESGTILKYSKELSDFGFCSFRVETKDSLFTEVGDVLEPHKYHVRIKQGTTIVWSGLIVDNPSRNKNFVEIKAAEYEFYFSKILVRRDPEIVLGDGKDNYKTFTSATMSQAVTAVVSDVRDDFGVNHPMNDLTIGTVENPDYPDGFSNEDGTPLTGPWIFSEFIQLQFDYHTAEYVLKAFGLYTNCDFQVTSDLVFNFKKFIGNKRTNVTFEYGTFGNVVDYDVPRLGSRVVNNYWGIAADDDGKILHVNQNDSVSQNNYGMLQEPLAFADVKNQNLLKTRVNEQLQFTKTPDSAPINLVLDEKAYPIGVYDIGDIVTVKIKDNVIDFNSPRRIVGITCNWHNTGRVLTTVQTNKPRDKDLGN